VHGGRGKLLGQNPCVPCGPWAQLILLYKRLVKTRAVWWAADGISCVSAPAGENGRCRAQIGRRGRGRNSAVLAASDGLAISEGRRQSTASRSCAQRRPQHTRLSFWDWQGRDMKENTARSQLGPPIRPPL
jgi:hypothetical protein